ncbi:hypothetical protein BSPWISOXPB_1350 [uncultured Gammaproteobacteria bacterium]|nr:hypothetical protein BSPWISOXPB_1350 [uncultured Gammaproteobacteria bacterium]
MQAKTQTLKVTIVSGLRIIDSNAQTGITWWNWTHNYFLHRLINNNDLLAVEKTISYLDKVSADSIPNLATGTCILAGLMAKIPVVIKVNEIKEKKNQPQSHNINLIQGWE